MNSHIFTHQGHISQVKTTLVIDEARKWSTPVSDSVSELGTRPANDQTWVGKHDDINKRRLCKEKQYKKYWKYLFNGTLFFPRQIGYNELTKLSILSFGIPERETGTSSRQLLKRFRISRFSRLATAGGNSVILLWLKVNLVMFFIPHILDMSGSREMRALSEKSSSAFWTPWASSRVFLMILEAMLTRGSN